MKKQTKQKELCKAIPGCTLHSVVHKDAMLAVGTMLYVIIVLSHVK